MISTRARNRRDAPAIDSTVSVSRATAIALSSVCLVLDGLFWVNNVKDIVKIEDPASLVIRCVDHIHKCSSLNINEAKFQD